MKILFISDMHGSLTRTQKVLSIAEKENVDLLAVLGDVMYHGPRNPFPEEYNPREVANLLNQWKDKVVAVRGNCDSEVDQMLIEYPMLSDYARVQANGHSLFLTHGHLWNRGKLPNIAKGSVLIYGHSHIPRAEIIDGIHVWNPGSCSLPKEGYPACYGMYDNGTFRAITLDGEVFVEQTLP